jgi:catechol-2,3-dioxygenase
LKIVYIVTRADAVGGASIHVRDLAAMERFYARYLGLLVTDRGQLGERTLVFLSRDAREHHQIVLVSGRADQSQDSVLNQVSLRVPDLDALRHFQAQAAACGGSDVHAITHGNAISLYVRDPEGNRLELYLDTPWYVSQPLRVPVDLAKADAAVWEDVHALARSLPGYKSADEWRRELEARIAAQ